LKCSGVGRFVLPPDADASLEPMESERAGRKAREFGISALSLVDDGARFPGNGNKVETQSMAQSAIALNEKHLLQEWAFFEDIIGLTGRLIADCRDRRTGRAEVLSDEVLLRVMVREVREVADKPRRVVACSFTDATRLDGPDAFRGSLETALSRTTVLAGFFTTAASFVSVSMLMTFLRFIGMMDSSLSAY
jgi:hypothetical protein